MTEKWKIWVSGYGDFDFEGTEAEAEEMRSHKARWEHGKGMKWRADNQKPSDKLTAEIVALWDADEGVPQSLLKRRSDALKAEREVQP